MNIIGAVSSVRRPRDAEVTRAAILAAARERFGAEGFARTTIRSVAAVAGVDPALVMHYFGNKDGLFAAAAELELHFPDLSEVEPDRIADALVPVFVAAWRPDGPFLALLRAGAGHPAATDALRRVFADQVAPALAAATSDHPRERAALFAAQMIGLAVGRYVMGIPPLVEMSDDDLVRWLRPVAAHYLSGPFPSG